MQVIYEISSTKYHLSFENLSTETDKHGKCKEKYKHFNDKDFKIQRRDENLKKSKFFSTNMNIHILM